MSEYFHPLSVLCECRLCKGEDPICRLQRVVDAQRAAQIEHFIEQQIINAYRMPTNEQETGGEEVTKEERSPSSNGSVVGNDSGSNGVPPELRAALPNVVWSKQEDTSYDEVTKEGNH